MKEITAEKKIKGGELLVATFLSMPEFNHTGTNMMAPPNPKAPPAAPAQKPESMEFHIFLAFIFSDSFSKI